MTNPTTPKAGDITEEIMAEFEEKWSPLCDLEDMKNLVYEALAKQKESIKEQLRMKKVFSEYPENRDEEIGCEGHNQAVDELNEKLDNL